MNAIITYNRNEGGVDATQEKIWLKEYENVKVDLKIE